MKNSRERSRPVVAGPQANRAAISRRNLLGVGAAVAAFTIVPRHVLGGAGQTPPSEKLNIAGIGIGGQGGSDLNDVSSENIVALCDVDWDYAAHTFKQYPKAKQYTRFSRHAREGEGHRRGGRGDARSQSRHREHDGDQARQARLLREAADPDGVRGPRHCQGGPRGQGRDPDGQSGHGLRGQPPDQRVDLGRGDRTGARGPRLVRPAHPQRQAALCTGPRASSGPRTRRPFPTRWTGTCGWVPLRIGRTIRRMLPFAWRGWWDFGSGGLGDMGIHNLAPVWSALEAGGPGQRATPARRSFNNETLPLASTVHYEFPARGDMPPVTLHWYDGGIIPPRPPELEDDRELSREDGLIFVGDKGKMYVEGWGGNSPRLIPESKMQRRTSGRPRRCPAPSATTPSGSRPARKARPRGRTSPTSPAR